MSVAMEDSMPAPHSASSLALHSGSCVHHMVLLSQVCVKA